MSEDLVLDLVCAIRADVERFGADLRDVRKRLDRLRELAASVSLRLDRIGDDLEQVRRHLEAS